MLVLFRGVGAISGCWCYFGVLVAPALSEAGERGRCGTMPRAIRWSKQDHAKGRTVVLGGGLFLMSEVPLYLRCAKPVRGAVVPEKRGGAKTGTNERFLHITN